MKPVIIDSDRCKACGLCIDVCNRHLLALDEGLNSKGYHPIAIHGEERCTSCTLCAVICPEGALEIRKEIKKKTAG